MRLQTDLEFQQNETKKLNKMYNIGMFSSRLRCGKALLLNKKLEN